MSEYFPSIEYLAAGLRLPKENLQGPKKTLVSYDLLRTLLRHALEALPFDEKAYLKQNPDLAVAWKRGEIGNLHEHFVNTGYFEGRGLTSVAFDEKWYVSTYSDVAEGIRKGQISTAKEHYEMVGEKEGRAPNPRVLDAVQAWNKLLSTKP